MPGPVSLAPLELYRRRWTAIFSLPVAFVTALGSVYGVMLINQFFDGRTAWMLIGIVAFLALCLVVPTAWTAWVAFHNRDPALIVDVRGITDRVKGLDTIPW